MNDERMSPNESAVDPLVAAGYADFARESAPPGLDRRVLREARQAVAARNSRFAFAAWVRPAAIAATGILCVAVILEFQQAGLLAPPSGDLPGAAAVPAAEPESRSAAETATALRREKAAATVSSKTLPAAPADEAAAGQLRDAARRADETLAESYRITGETFPDTAAADRIDADGRGQCDAEARADAASWWLCIETLRSAGMDDLAETELTALRNRFPAFAVPE